MTRSKGRGNIPAPILLPDNLKKIIQHNVLKINDFNSCSKKYQKKFKKYLELIMNYTYIALKLIKQ